VRRSSRWLLVLGMLYAPAVLSACAASDRTSGAALTAGAKSTTPPLVNIPGKTKIGIGIGPAKIKHIVFVIQENRSFDYIFGGLDQNGLPFPGADTVSNPLPGEPTPHDHLGNPVTMQTGLLEECYNPAHENPNANGDIDKGAMDGFDKENIQQLSCAPGTPPPDYVYRFVNEAEVLPYWQMGEQYAISDRMFESIKSSSFASHLFFVAGQSARTIDQPTMNPWGCDSNPTNLVDIYNEKTGGVINGVYPCFNVLTLADLMDQRQVNWRYYGMTNADFGYNWISYDAIYQIREGPDWSKNVFMPSGQFLTDVANGTLASMTWITPSLADSDHPVSASNLGPSWIASVVDAVGESQFWDTTAVFILWDDWGGWYDHVPPPTTGPVGLGIRVPIIVVSPYAKKAYVSHTTHSFGSMLHFTEEVFNLPNLGQEDAADDDFADMFDFTQTPNTFSPFKSHYGRKAVMHSATVPSRPPAGAPAEDD
jgi:phospholipase C